MKEESQELMVQQLWDTVQQQATVQEGQEKKVSFRINFQKQHKITCTITVTFLSRRLCQRQLVSRELSAMQDRQPVTTRAKLFGPVQETGTIR